VPDSTFLDDAAGPLAVALGVAVVVLLVAVIMLARRVGDLRRRVDAVTRDADGRSLAGVLEAHLDKVYAVSHRQDALEGRAAVIEATQARTVQGLALVRFNPYDDTGGNQSFVLAAVDPAGNGAILTSLHARNQTRLYGKAVIDGAIDGPGSVEEDEALQLARARAAGAAGR
jgi:hypothetical protein